MKGIADTGFLVAFASKGDRHHNWAMGVAGQVTEPLLTCESVLSEVAFHLGSSSYVLSLMADQMIRLAFEVNRHVDALRDLALYCQLLSDLGKRAPLDPTKPTSAFIGETNGTPFPFSVHQGHKESATST